ncbi:MMPL family transporter [Kitasatospora purpeofusca]|uniref:MMPL family transporter n=1 Tax=Kitasatospora purpeofusca TaxID=67352 RepID=UPI0036EF9FC4
MPAGFSDLIARHRRAVLAAALMLMCLLGWFDLGVFGRLSNGGDTPLGAESATATAAIRENFGHGGTDAVAVYRSDRWTADDPAFREEVQASLSSLPPGVVTGAQDYWNTGSRAFLSEDRHSAAVVLSLGGPDDTAKMASYRTVRSTAHPDGIDVAYGGQTPFYADTTDLARSDLARAELFCAPVLFLLLWLVFGTLTAAVLPMAVAAASIVAATAALRLLTLVMPVSVLTLNLVTMVAMALAVDYALFIVARFREELDRGSEPARALAVTMASAGHTVLFSGLTIAAAMLALVALPFDYTRSVGVAGAVTALLAVLTSLTLLPAALAVLGHRVNTLRLPVPRWLRNPVAAVQSTAEQSAWARLGRSVIRRPVRYLAVTLVALAALTLPMTHARFGATDHRTLPQSAPVRQATEAISRDFPALGLDRIQVVTQFSHSLNSPEGSAALETWKQQLTALPGAGSVHVTAVSGRSAVVTVSGPRSPHSGPESGPAADLVESVRALPAPDGGAFDVGGPAAATVDLRQNLRTWLPLIGLCIALTSFALLLLAFRSVVVPLKALLTTGLSLGVAFGVVTWIFQDGHLSRRLDFQPNGYIGALEPVVMLALLFGLSIDYELFLLSRIREHYRRTGDNEAAIVTGLRQSGGIITSAAVLMLTVVAAFATSGVLMVKEIAIGIFVAVAVDATLVRALLVPATLRLLGDANWWAPGRPPSRPVGDPNAADTGTTTPALIGRG